MLQNDPNKRFEFQDRETTPILTAMLIFMVVLMYSMGHGLSGTKADPGLYIIKNCFNLHNVQALLDKKDFQSLLTLGFTSQFTTFDLIPMAFNMYFFWVFGKHVESKLGIVRYMMLVMLGIYVPLVALYYDLQRSGSDMTFCGPMFVLCTIIGTYLVFPPIPKSKIGSGQTQQQKGQIFKKGGRPDPLEKYTGNPYMFVVTFAIIQALFHFWITMKKPLWVFNGMDGIDTTAVFPIIAGGIIGWLMGQALEQQATAALKESPMTLSAVKRYHELIDLDVGHEDALRGTARTLGVPYDKVKQWVAKNKGSMRIK